MTRKIIFGISEYSLTPEEIQLFTQHPPFGIILFKRNCLNPLQVKELNKSIKELIPEVKIFVDQEGGRVARLKAPEFIEFPAASSLKTSSAVYENYSKMGKYLYELGFDGNCAPVADLYYPYADKIIGDRSFGSDVDHVATLARSTANALLDVGVLPVIKHIPGHGRALVDSHLELPIVEAHLEELEKTDFAVFKQLNDLPLAMTAHVIYTALDSKLPVTLSKKAIDYIRNNIGFKGLIMSDDLNMKALKGNLKDLSNQAIEAGCDIILHCSGNIDEMKEILSSNN